MATGDFMRAGVFVMAGGWLAAGRPAFAAATLAVGAAISCACRAARREDWPIWAWAGAFTGSMAGNLVAWDEIARRGLPHDGGLADLALALHAASILAIAAATWLGVRPLLTDRASRRPALITLPSGLMAIGGLMLADGAWTIGSRPLLVLGVGLAFTGFAVGLVGFSLLGGHLARNGHQAELIAGAGLLAHMLSQSISLLLEREEGIWLAVALSSTGFLVAARTATDTSVGEAEGSRLFRVRVWPVLVAVIAMVAVWLPLRRTTVDPSVTAALVLAGALTVLFAARELAGPRKPVVLPFGRRDRALQLLPNQLLRDSVRLIGRPVHRVHDGALVGIEAEPSWSRPDAPELSLSEVAADARLNNWLQDVTLLSARAHLPAVVHGLDGDDPFLSVPFDPTLTPAAPDEALDGLMLRIGSTPTDPDVVAAWQDRGAMIESTTVAMQFCADTDVVRVEPGDHVPAVAMGLAHLGSEPADPPPPLDAEQRGLMFVVDPNRPKVALGQLLSGVTEGPSSPLTVTPVRSRPERPD